MPKTASGFKYEFTDGSDFRDPGQIRIEGEMIMGLMAGGLFTEGVG